MNYLGILFAAIGGGLGGCIGYFLGRRFQKSWAMSIAYVVPVVLLAEIGNYIGKSYEPLPIPNLSARLDKALKDFSTEISNTPSYKQATIGLKKEEVFSFTQKHTHDGLKRLPAEDLKDWNRIRLLLAEKNKDLCAGFWNGKINTQSLFSTLDLLKDEDLKKWFYITQKALISDLDKLGSTDVDDQALSQGMESISKTLNVEDSVRVQTIMQQAENANDQDSCWIMTTILRGAEIIPDDDLQYKFIQALSAL